jgi:hypothetical protein
MRFQGAFGIAGAAGLCCVGIAFGVASSVGCSSSSTPGDGSSSGGASDHCTSGAACTVAPSPSGGATTVTKSHNYAVSKVYLGSSNRDGSPDSGGTAWQKFGYNLDNLVTTRASTDVCTLTMGAGKDYQVDGQDGIDNSFGENILPVITSTAGDVETTLNNTIKNGHFTLMNYVTGLDDSTTTQTATGLTGVLLSGTDYTHLDAGAIPSPWTPSLNWPVAPELLTCGPSSCSASNNPVSAAKVKFNSAYVNNGTFVNGNPSDVQLTLDISGQILSITAHAAILTFKQAGAGMVTNGTIAGVLDPQELVTAVHGVAGHLTTSLCSQSAFQSIQDTILQAADIVNNGGTISNSAGVACNAISIGLGFDAVEIAAPSTIAPPTPPAADPCADAGGH